MGYYTQFSLFVYNADKQPATDQETIVINSALEEISGYGDTTFSTDGNGHSWYDHQDHCMAVSEQYPDFYIEITGQGENSDDIWKRLYHKGECIAHWYLQIEYPGIEEMLSKYAV